MSNEGTPEGNEGQFGPFMQAGSGHSGTVLTPVPSVGNGSRPQYIQVTTPALRLPPPEPQRGRTPYFEGRNVTNFVKNWERFCKRYNLTEEEKVDRVEEYCAEGIANIICGWDEYRQFDWDGLQKRLKSTYYRHDDEVWKRDPSSLEALSNMTRKKEENGDAVSVSDYCLQFEHVYNLVKEGEQGIPDSFVVTYFLRGLPATARKYVCSKVSMGPRSTDPTPVSKVIEIARRFDDQQEVYRQVESVGTVTRANNYVSEFMKTSIETEGEANGKDETEAFPSIFDVPKLGTSMELDQSQTTRPASKAAKEKQTELDQLAEAFSKMNLSAAAYTHALTAPVYRSLTPMDIVYLNAHVRLAPEIVEPSVGPLPVQQLPPRPQYGSYPQQSMRPVTNLTCFGCGGSHRFAVGSCPELSEMATKGQIHYNASGRLAWGPQGQFGPEIRGIPQMGKIAFLHKQLKQQQSEASRPVNAGSSSVQLNYVDVSHIKLDRGEDPHYEQWSDYVDIDALDKVHIGAATRNTRGEGPSHPAVVDHRSKVRKKVPKAVPSVSIPELGRIVDAGSDDEVFDDDD
ncbi:MAG: hypothetical protein M1822_002426 [Bathelium mastoideum]|nr:MAG: hypothetical protein M1822_002426 [Bathelium mastoideum]